MRKRRMDGIAVFYIGDANEAIVIDSLRDHSTFKSISAYIVRKHNTHN